jgi:hypothetical protein
LNYRLDDVTLVPTTRKPFDVLTKGLITEKNRGDKTAIELFCREVASWPTHITLLLAVTR